MPLSTTQYGFIIDPMVPFTDASGTTIRNGYVRVFVAGSSTPVITYKNYDGATNEETIQLDNSGRTAYPVIVSKGNTYKVCVYDAEHSQESPILTIDKVVPAGANVEATNIVTGLDNVESPEAGWVKSTVSGTDAEVSLDATNVTSEVDTMVKATAASADYMMPLVHKTGSDPDKKITLGNIFKFVLNFIHSLTDTATESDIASGNYFALDGSAGTKKLNSTTLLTKTAQNALDSIHSSSASTTNQFASRIVVTDKSTNKTKEIDAVLVASSESVNKIDRDLNGIPDELPNGDKYAGQIGSSTYNYAWRNLDSATAKYFLIDVSKLRGLHLTDKNANSRTYAWINYYKTPVEGEIPFFCSGYAQRYSGTISHAVIPSDASYLYCVAPGNEYDYPAFTIDEASTGKFESLEIDTRKIDGYSEENLQYSVNSLKSIASTVSVGGQVSFSDNNYRNVGAVNVPDYGVLTITSVLSNTYDKDVVVCDENDAILGILSYSKSNSYAFTYTVELEKYPGAKKVYFNFSISGDAPTVSFDKYGLNQIATNDKRRGVVLLHFDAQEIADNGTIISSRRALLEEYGIMKASACLSKLLFGNGDDNTFSSWINSDIEAEYWNLIKQGWDFALYPALYASQKTEAEWNTFMDIAFANLANLNVHNVTCWACGRLDVTHDLLNACIKHNIKILRGGSDGDETSQGDYDYTEKNLYMPTNGTKETTIVNKTIFYNSGSNIERVRPYLERAADMHAAVSIFTHRVYDGATGNTDCSTENFRKLLQVIADLRDAGRIDVMTWREYYAMVNDVDGYNNDYNRLVKMCAP